MESQNKEFDEADKKLDEVRQKESEKAKQKAGFNSNVELKRKVFMKISDVDKEDAEKFKNWCDKHTDKKQFLGIKLLMQMAELEPILLNLIKQINDIKDRVEALESAELPEDDDKVQIPKTQGRNRK